MLMLCARSIKLCAHRCVPHFGCLQGLRFGLNMATGLQGLSVPLCSLSVTPLCYLSVAVLS